MERDNIFLIEVLENGDFVLDLAHGVLRSAQKFFLQDFERGEVARLNVSRQVDLGGVPLAQAVYDLDAIVEDRLFIL